MYAYGGRLQYVRSGRSTPMTFPYNRGWSTHQPKSVGVYITIIRIPYSRWEVSHPQYKELIDPGSYFPKAPTSINPLNSLGRMVCNMSSKGVRMHKDSLRG